VLTKGVDTRALTAAFLIAFLMGGYRVTRDNYREWRERRLNLPDHERNSGFLTDARLRAFEISAATLFWLVVAVHLLAVGWIIGLARGWWA